MCDVVMQSVHHTVCWATRGRRFRARLEADWDSAGLGRIASPAAHHDRLHRTVSRVLVVEMRFRWSLRVCLYYTWCMRSTQPTECSPEGAGIPRPLIRPLLAQGSAIVVRQNSATPTNQYCNTRMRIRPATLRTVGGACMLSDAHS